MKTIAAVLIFLICGVGAGVIVIARTETRATAEICTLIRENYYRAQDTDVQKFLSDCESEPATYGFSRKAVIKNINRRLSVIQSSHLSLYEPQDTIRMWENEGSDTGLRTRRIDGELVVLATLPESPARWAELKPGDVIVSINDQTEINEDDAQTTPGFYKVARAQKFFQTNLKLEDLREDLSPSIVTLSKGSANASSKDLAVLRIPSFLPQYFEQETWTPLAERLNSYSRVIIDLRGNAGGSFPAMLRALSPFKCGSPAVGELWRSQAGYSNEPVAMQDDLRAKSQLELFQISNRVSLTPFTAAPKSETKPAASETKTCFNGSVLVLIDNNTSSVSEIFAESLRAGARSHVWGWTTAGQVVMARWFPVGSLGGGDYAISIPIAGYRTSSGEELERKGVTPEKELYYNLENELRGEDSWINEASRAKW